MYYPNQIIYYENFDGLFRQYLPFSACTWHHAAFSRTERIRLGIDSAGTGNWHCGNPPDKRSIKVAQSYGIDISTQRARQFKLSDFDEFDLILVMDRQNYRDVISLAKDQNHKNKVQLFIPDGIVPDPYWDDTQFQPVYDLIYNRSEKLIQEIIEKQK